jgi:hypothetical protein
MRAPVPRALLGPARSGLAGLVSLVGLAGLSLGACADKTDVELWVDGFLPEHVRFEIEDLGPLEAAAVDRIAGRPDIDGSLRLPAGACSGPCRTAVVSVFVHNLHTGAEAIAPPVVRLQSPTGRPARPPIAFRGGEISPRRVGRIRWVVELWPEEKRLTATLSSSVYLVDTPRPPAGPAPSLPAPPLEPKGDP